MDGETDIFDKYDELKTPTDFYRLTLIEIPMELLKNKHL